MASPRKVGKKSPARPGLERTDSESESECFSAPPLKRQQPKRPETPPPTTTDSSPMPELLADDVKTESGKKTKKIINLRLSFDDLPPQEGNDIFKTYSPQEMTCCNLDWMANTEVRLTLSKLSLSSKEERYRPSAPTPTAAECPVIIKPIPMRLTVPVKPPVLREESRDREEGRHRKSDDPQSGGIRTEIPSQPPGMFAFWKRTVPPKRSPSPETQEAQSSNNDDAEVPCAHPNNK